MCVFNACERRFKEGYYRDVRGVLEGSDSDLVCGRGSGLLLYLCFDG